MRTFSDLLVTDQTIQVFLQLDVIKDNGIPFCEVVINNTCLFSGELQSTKTFTVATGIYEEIDLTISMSGKKYSQELETAILLQQLKIDQFALLPNWSQLATYASDQGEISATSYLGFNGTWRLFVDEPFYRWKHRVTGRGWLLTPTTKFQNCVASSSSTSARHDHTLPGNI